MSVDFSKMEFEETAPKPGWIEIRILAPLPEGILSKPQTFRTGDEARKKLVRYVMASTSSLVPHLAREIEDAAAQIHASIDAGRG